MKTSSAQLRIFFDNRGFQPVLPGAHRCRVAAGAATNHNQVVCHVTPFYMARLYTMVGGMARISLVLLLFAGLLAPLSSGQNPPNQATARNFSIDSINVEGNRILAAPAIITASG